MVIQHNLSAENSARMHKLVSGKLSGISEKLASGYKINRGADDAAGLAISEKMRFQIRGLNRGSSNIEDGVSYCQVAEGALSEMQDMLHRMNELCIQAANGTLSSSDRKHVNEEIQQLKAEIERTCYTTQFNEEYIFRCEDELPTEPHAMYRVSISGTPKDLFIYNESYDEDNIYAGVVFRGRRYTWDEISPNMYDKETQTFHKGIYAIRADDGTVLTLACDEDGGLPQVSREFVTSADGVGIYINNDLAVEWDKISVSGNMYSFDYHGLTISFTREEGDTFDDMVRKLTGTVWESKYQISEPSKALDANFTFSQYSFKNNDRVAGYVNGRRTKYILHAVDGNQGGTIPDGNGNRVPFDGIWLEGTDDNWNPTGQSLYAMTWEQLGFGCKDYTYHDPDNTTDHPDYCDWGNQSTDIWAGDDPQKDPNDYKSPYPPDVGSNTFYNYDSYNPFTTRVQEENNSELVSFIFSVINEISKEDAIQALNDIRINYGTVKTYDNVKVKTTGNITNLTKSLSLTLADEYNLGRDYENGKSQCDLTNYERLTYNSGRFSVTYSDSTRRSVTFSTNNIYISSYGTVSSWEDKIIQNGTIVNETSLNVSPANRDLSVSLNMTSAGGSSLSLAFTYSNFFANNRATVKADESPDGKYVIRNGRYVLYDAKDYPDPDDQPDRYNVRITNSAGTTFQEYVYSSLAGAIQLQLEATGYPTAILSADENKNSAMVTRYSTPVQHEPLAPARNPAEQPEYLLIQCSSNIIDNIEIQKQRLSLNRLGLTNVATLSQMQATGCIDTVGAALAKVTRVRSLFGAYQNRLERAYDINRNTHENTQSAESVIRDTDMAKAMVEFSNDSILQQAAQSMLAQANQVNQNVLALLS